MTTFLTVDQMAAKVHKAPRTIQRWARERQIPHVRLGRSILFTEDQVQQIVSAYSVEPVERAPEADIVNPSFAPRGPVVVPMRRGA